MQVIVRDPALSGGQTTVNYTVPTGASLNTIASGLAGAINAGSGLAALGITATSKQRVITVKTLSPNVTNFTGSVSGAGATVTMSLGVSLNGSVTALISGTATANDVLTISVFDAGLSGGQRDISYTVLPSDTLATITSALAAAINADSQLRLIGIKASASSTKLTVTSVSTNDTTYLPSKSAGATETILWGLPANGTVTASVAGSITAGDIVTITVFDAGLSGGSTSMSHTVAAGDTRKIIATSLASQINGNASLAAIGVTALAVTPAGSVNVVNITSASSNATTYAKSTSPGATLSLTLSKSVGVTKATFNNVNELTSLSAGGATRFQGTTDRPVLPVTVDGNAADMTTSQSFNGNAVLDVNPDSVPVSATTGGGSGTTTNDYKLDYVGANATLTFDANGNMTSDGTNSYSWDAENRLVQITYSGSGNNSQFAYDPLGRNVKIEERTAGSVTSTKQYVWVRWDRREERNASGNLTKEFFDAGQLNGSTKYFYATDWLGSIRELTDNSGAIQAEYSYDPYGRPTKIVESSPSDFGYAGLFVHSRSGLNFAAVRNYNPSLGRWLNRDPIGERGGLNLYRYARSNPISFFDQLGMMASQGGTAATPPDPGSIGEQAASSAMGGGGGEPPDPNKKPPEKKDPDPKDPIDKELEDCLDEAEHWLEAAEEILKRPDNQKPKCSSKKGRRVTHEDLLEQFAKMIADCIEEADKKRKKRNDQDEKILQKMREWHKWYVENIKSKL
ncbi:MAG: RHS repeat-associated core domain-containing protein [Candidatus Obscuribacterales bacterium]